MSAKKYREADPKLEQERQAYIGFIIRMLEDVDLRTCRFVYTFLLRTLTLRR